MNKGLTTSIGGRAETIQYRPGVHVRLVKRTLAKVRKLNFRGRLVGQTKGNTKNIRKKERKRREVSIMIYVCLGILIVAAEVKKALMGKKHQVRKQIESPIQD